MPQFTHLDRCIIEAETMLWLVNELMSNREHSGQWSERIAEVQKEVQQIAIEMREYNDQFETEE